MKKIFGNHKCVKKRICPCTTTCLIYKYNKVYKSQGEKIIPFEKDFHQCFKTKCAEGHSFNRDHDLFTFKAKFLHR